MRRDDFRREIKAEAQGLANIAKDVDADSRVVSLAVANFDETRERLRSRVRATEENFLRLQSKIASTEFEKNILEVTRRSLASLGLFDP